MSKDSPLRQLPPRLDPRQMIFLDGIRHAIDISMLSYQRLTLTLTEIAREWSVEDEIEEAPFTAAFLDAWAFVDAVHRFCSLVRKMPGMSIVGVGTGKLGVLEQEDEIRNLRNVADHLAMRVDYIVARNSTALGILTWITRKENGTGNVLSCVLLPGTVQSGKGRALLVNPVGRTLDTETGMIHLTAGEHSTCLSNVATSLAAAVQRIEESLDAVLTDEGVRDQHAGADLLLVAEFSPSGSAVI